jgi:membrane-bound serine protease (ClpP class)
MFAAARAASQPSTEPQVEVIEVSGLLDDSSLTYLSNAIESAADAGREVVIIQINSPGVIGSLELLTETAALVADPPVPLVVWLGPAPARVGGGAAQLYASAPLQAAAPGTRIENWQPAVAAVGGEVRPPPPAWTGTTEVTGTTKDLVDLAVPTLTQLVQELDGRILIVGGEERVLTTLSSVPVSDAVGSSEGLTTIPVTFTQPGLWNRFLRMAARPEAAFFFLVAGLTVAVFEMYAIGPGVAAAVAAISVFLSAYGLSVLPVRWWAVGAAVAAIGVLTASVQKGGVLALAILGSALLVWSGFNFTAGQPQVAPSFAGVIFAILAVLFIFLLAIPTVARARFSTQTIGRDRLIGRSGRALTRFGFDGLPAGLVEIDGARWPATSHREARIDEGSEVVVVAVQGWRVEVDPPSLPVRENYP